MEAKESLSSTDVVKLREQVTGFVAAHGDPDYDRLRASWNLVVENTPRVAVSALCETDVQVAVRFAFERNLSIAVMATGHGQARTCDHGLLIRMSGLNHVEIDPHAATATVGGGATWANVVEAAFPHGLAPLSGSSPGVGVVGYLLGGGYSLMLRKHGLAVDHVRSFRVVLADGSLVDVSRTSHPDLFWAMLGGGGTFGIVTEVTIGLFPHAFIYGGAMMFPAERANELYKAYCRWVEDLDEDVTSGINLMTFPPVPFVPEFLQGRSMVILCAAMSADEEKAAEHLKYWRDLGPEFDMFGVMPYTESARVYNDPVDPLPVNGRGVLLKELTEETVDKMLEAIGPAPASPNLMIQLRHLGGAMARQDESFTSIGDRRQAEFLIYFLGVPMGPVTPDQMASHAEGVFQAIEPWVLSRGPLNFLGERDVSASHVRSIYGDSDYERLLKTKETYDPGNLFRFAGVGLSD